MIFLHIHDPYYYIGYTTLQNYFKSLSDETRLRIINILKCYELSVNELVNILDMGQSRISRHLKILSDAGLLSFRRDGLWVFYKLVNKGRANSFLHAVIPFIDDNSAYKIDINNAEKVFEERNEKTKFFFNSIAKSWNELNREVLGDFNLTMKICDYIPLSCRVAADLGCGTGILLKQMLQFSDLVIGVDGSSKMLELSRELLIADNPSNQSSISLRIGDLEHLPLRDGEADFACMSLVLHHLFKPQTVFGEVHRILKQKGLLLIVDFKQHDHEIMRIKYNDRWLGFDIEIIKSQLELFGFKMHNLDMQPVEKELSLFFMLLEKK